jgi:hypothetical protein
MFDNIDIITHNKRIQLPVKSVTFFAKKKNAPLFTSADAGVRHQKKTSEKLMHRFLKSIDYLLIRHVTQVEVLGPR